MNFAKKLSRVARPSAGQRAAMVCALGVVLLLSAFPVAAQQNGSANPSQKFSLGASTDVYQDSASTSCDSSNTSPYKGMDPLACYGVMAPTDSGGRCSLAGMTIFKQTGGTCYYCKPIQPPTPGILVPIDDIAAADRQGYRCGVDQADPNCMAVCTRESGSGSFVPPSGTTLVAGPPPGPGQPPASPRNPPAAPPRPPLQGSASGNPCQPFGPTGYDYCANPAGTQPPGCVCSPPGNKGLFRDKIPPKPAPVQPPAPQPKPPPTPSLTTIDNAMNACLKAVVPYWRAESVEPNYLAMARQYVGKGNVTSTALTFMDEIAMGLQAQAARASQYGGSNSYNQADATDYMVGWLDHCLYRGGLVPKSQNLSPNDPRLLYSQFLGVPLSDRRIDIFEQGWGDDALAPLPLLPPGKKTF
jgi:hypothetical protein